MNISHFIRPHARVLNLCQVSSMVHHERRAISWESPSDAMTMLHYSTVWNFFRWPGRVWWSDRFPDPRSETPTPKPARLKQTSTPNRSIKALPTSAFAGHFSPHPSPFQIQRSLSLKTMANPTPSNGPNSLNPTIVGSPAGNTNAPSTSTTTSNNTRSVTAMQTSGSIAGASVGTGTFGVKVHSLFLCEFGLTSIAVLLLIGYMSCLFWYV